MKLNLLFQSVLTHCSEEKLARVASLPLLGISKFKSRNKVELLGIDRSKQFKAIHPNASVNYHRKWCYVHAIEYEKGIDPSRKAFKLILATNFSRLQRTKFRNNSYGVFSSVSSSS
jgi:hypothetical protein